MYTLFCYINHSVIQPEYFDALNRLADVNHEEGQMLQSYI